MSRTPSLQLVHHLEAATAKEESFLLLMGLSRLPGGRQFAPQADVTLELKLNEIDPVGKTFDETTLEIHFRPAREAADEWKVLRGTVGELDDLTMKVWEELSRQLTGVDPKAGLDYLKEMAERRRQAREELEKLRSMRAHGVWDIVSLERGQQILRTAAAAAKLDPTSEEAAFFSLKFHYLVQRVAAVRDKSRGPELMKPLLTETLRYLSRCEERRAEALDIAHAAIHWVLAPEYARTHQTRDRLLSLLHKGLPPEWKPRAPDPATMDTVRQLVDLGVAGPLHH
ncbi:MAG: hypothetical protein KAX80_07625, partial [Planctomycetes bacterium]|nr:hypothetical protein [Planctomycetota bacterium]